MEATRKKPRIRADEIYPQTRKPSIFIYPLKTDCYESIKIIRNYSPPCAIQAVIARSHGDEAISNRNETRLLRRLGSSQ
jgi:hypothetical protein